MNKKGMGLFSVVLLLLALTIGAAISAGDITPEKVEGIKGNFTIDELNISLDEGINQELGNALNYYANGLLNAYEELAKWVMTYAAEHPEIPYKLLFFLIIISFCTPIIIMLVKLLVIIFLLIKECIQGKREKKLLKRKK